MSFLNLVAESGSKLESIEVTDSNIRDFRKIADKHHIKYALKRDSDAEGELEILYPDRIQEIARGLTNPENFVKLKEGNLLLTYHTNSFLP